MDDIVTMVTRCHELLTAPCSVSFKDMNALSTANPQTFGPEVDAFAAAFALRGWSKAECRRRGVSMSSPQDTLRPTLKWASVKLGRNDYEPIYIEHGPR